MNATGFPLSTMLTFIVVALLVAVVPLLLARFWAARFSRPKPGPSKNANYECGIESVAPLHARFGVHYYLYAIVFLVFDVEVVFLLPFAVAFQGLPVGAAVAMLVFVLLLLEGLVWAWAKGLLDWR